MASPSPKVVAILVILLAMAAPARAQEEPAAPYEMASLRFRYGVSLRQGVQADLGPGLQYTGWTPNDFAGSGRYWFGPMIGAAVSAQREGFALFTTDGTRTRVSGGGLLRINAGPSGRLMLGPITLEALVGYQLAQLPTFGNSALPDTNFAAITRHSLLGAGRASVELPALGARLELHGEYPVPLVVSAPSGDPAKSSGLSGGAALIIPVGQSGTFVYSVVADYQYVQDAVALGPDNAPTFTASQALQRAGVALQLDLLDHAPAPKFGTVLVRAVDADSGQPISTATVALSVAGRELQVRQGGAAGSFNAQDVPPGSAVAKVVAVGYLPAEAKATVIAGQEAVFELKVKKEPPKTGSLLVTLLDKVTKKPVAGATVKVRGVEKQTGDDGQVKFDGLLPGPAPVEAAVPDYHPVNEVASIVALKTAELPLPLVRSKAAILATITGLVRNSNGGRPVSAMLEIPEAKVKTRAVGTTGAFTFRIQGGTYSLIISAPGFITQTKTVTVKDGDQAIYNVDLHPSR
ncbi:MAG TPA: carboxypeptidase regulatory-like domain-containing protein [Myxococcaceae bacterium]|nr:carboxypeptidase regulatory-like domain-containing protein [Myxococcaceae bacterium]